MESIREHREHKHDYVTCGAQPFCENEFCNYCVGELKCCKVCRGAEVSLPSECPGVRMTEDQERGVTAEIVDFRGGEWVEIK